MPPPPPLSQTKPCPHTPFIYENYLLAGRGIVEDVIDSGHLDQDGTVTQGVANGRQPRCEVAERSCHVTAGGRDDMKDGVHIEYDSTHSNQVVELRAGQFDEPEGGRVKLLCNKKFMLSFLLWVSVLEVENEACHSKCDPHTGQHYANGSEGRVDANNLLFRHSIIGNHAWSHCISHVSYELTNLRIW